MKRMLRSRKGVSPVLATVLMIVIAVIGMNILFAFAVNYATDFQLGRGSSVLESLVIEMVYWDGVSTNADIWVYNVGKVDLEIGNVYVNDRLASITEIDDVPVIEQTLVAVPVGNHTKIGVTADSFNVGGRQLYKLATARGSIFEGRY
jgi:flagellin-like protein